MSFTSYEVGKQIFPITHSDAAYFQLSDSGATLTLLYTKPTAKDKRDFKSPLQLKITIVDEIIFILARFGTAQWIDMPFERSKALFTSLPALKENEGICIHCMLADADTGILLAQRIVGAEYDFSSKLINAVSNQPSIPDFDSRLNRIYAKYSTVALLERSE